MTQQSFNPGMKELGDIVAGLYKDVKLLKECSWLGGAEKYASKHKGWTATKEDLTGPQGVPDGVDEILVRDKKGNIRVINCYTLTPSKHALRQAYYSEVPRNDDKTLRDLGYEPDSLRYKMMFGRPKKGMTMKKFKDERLFKYVPDYNPDDTPTGTWSLIKQDKLTPASLGLRALSKPTPNKIFKQLLKNIWDVFMQRRKEALGEQPDPIPVEQKLPLYNLWSNHKYLNRVVIPALQSMGVDYESLPYREDVAKITNKSTFKNKALSIIANMQNQGVEEEIYAELGEFFNRGPEYVNVAFKYHPKPPKPEELKQHRGQSPFD